MSRVIKGKNHLTTGEVAKLFGVTLRIVQGWIATAKNSSKMPLQFITDPHNGHYYCSEEEVKRLLKELVSS